MRTGYVWILLGCFGLAAIGFYEASKPDPQIAPTQLTCAGIQDEMTKQGTKESIHHHPQEYRFAIEKQFHKNNLFFSEPIYSIVINSEKFSDIAINFNQQLLLTHFETRPPNSDTLLVQDIRFNREIKQLILQKKYFDSAVNKEADTPSSSIYFIGGCSAPQAN